MKFKVSQKVFAQYPNLIEAVVILRNIDNTIDGKEILKLLRSEEEKIISNFSTAQLSNHPFIKSWQETFKLFGSNPNKFSSSVEALLKRILKGNKLPDINPLVNLYNYCSIKHILPFGGEDFNGVYGDIELKHCSGKEEFIPILSKENEPPDKGEISWCDNKGVTCRKWNWRQCDRTKITEKTKDGYFIIDVVTPTLMENIEEAGNNFINLAIKYLNANGEVYCITKDNPIVEINVKTKKLNNKPKIQNNTKMKKYKVKYFRVTSLPSALFEDENQTKYYIRDTIWEALKMISYDKYIKKEEINVEHPQNESFGDFSTNIAMVLSRNIKKKPNEIANNIIDKITFNNTFIKPKIIGGFINIDLKKEYLLDYVTKILNKKGKFRSVIKDNFRLIIEFGQPNTHKMPHIGHLFSYILGESISRIYEYLGFEVFRANYQGDVGPHVAKCLWALRKYKPEITQSYRNKADILQKMYQLGSTAYTDDKKAFKEITDLNKMIYMKDPSVFKLWKETREWSVNFYKEFEKQLGVRYDRYYFESEVASLGKEIVLKNIDRVFKKSKGAIIFKGSKYGLHDRVFITKEGTPTYEAKDMALQPLKYKEWPFDFMVIMTAHEQNEYFNVVFKALETLDKIFKGKLMHLGFGMIQLKSGKMSSRSGNIITGIYLIEQGINSIKAILDKRKSLSKSEKENISQVVGIGAVKYSFLKTNPLQNTKFSLEESISLEGNSCPYIQYTYSRARSILKKQSKYKIDTLDSLKEIEEINLLKMISRFNESVIESAVHLSPNILCSYLYDISQKYNLFYKKYPVLNSKEQSTKDARLTLTEAVSVIIKQGLNLLGIDVVERM